MRLIDANIDEVKITPKRPYSKNYELVMEFLDSGKSSQEIVEFTHKSAASCASSFYQTITNYKLFTVGVSQRGNRVFLYKKEI